MPVEIPAQYFHWFREKGKELVFAAGSMVFAQGDPADNLYLITQGRVRAFVLSQSGQEANLEILGVGRVFGDASFLQDTQRGVSVQAVTQTSIVVCSASAVMALCRESEALMRLMFQQMAESSYYLTHQVTRLVHYSSRQKVADFLVNEFERRGMNKPGDVLPYTHEEIAHSVSLNRVTVSRILEEFKERGMLDSRYGGIRLLDRRALEKLLKETE